MYNDAWTAFQLTVFGTRIAPQWEVLSVEKPVLRERPENWTQTTTVHTMTKDKTNLKTRSYNNVNKHHLIRFQSETAHSVLKANILAESAPWFRILYSVDMLQIHSIYIILNSQKKGLNISLSCSQKQPLSVFAANISVKSAPRIMVELILIKFEIFQICKNWTNIFPVRTRLLLFCLHSQYIGRICSSQ